MISAFLSQLDALSTQIRRGKPVNVNDRQTKDAAIALAKSYFSEVRPVVLRVAADRSDVTTHDEKWQHLISLAHGNNARRTYTTIVKGLRKELTMFNVASLSGANLTNVSNRTNHNAAERMLIDTLDRLVPSAAISYRQGLQDLSAADRVSYRGTSAEFRESLREVLDHLAPDVEVMGQAGFKPEPNQTKPTMKQKVRFLLSSRGLNKTQREPSEKSVLLVEELSGEVARAVYNRASVAAHVHESKREVEQIRRYVDTILYDLLEIS